MHYVCMQKKKSLKEIHHYDLSHRRQCMSNSLPVEYLYRSQDLPSANGRLQTMPTTITALFSFCFVQAGFTGRPDVPQ